MRIGILGNGALAVALGTVWDRAGHEVVIAGRSRDRAVVAASRIGGRARAADSPAEAVTGRDAVLLAVAWEGVPDILRAAGADAGSLAGTPLIDPTNAVEHGVGVLLPADGRAAAEHIADWAPGAQVVKGFHLFPAEQWGTGGEPVTVVLAGDEEPALRTVSTLVRDAGGHPTVLGSLNRARQLEEVAGFVIALAFSGQDPNAAIPRVPVLTKEQSATAG
ncbi:NADPH-dependent F420 reductase [Actinacidiphila acididurans]|uniref:NAD(P)-binding domain-containing protein n=1 Tax=Actinacidiphila acididurans TaxID=2784346 RepID=A0ABS2TPS1_9ACTN|nr:NAD(P)-binding domain-containing protein [Actinacidiphila acididurans]MBM9505333.1 NAD(P)-binding domain-containing protein [Actinacidiphila acididurans]